MSLVSAGARSAGAGSFDAPAAYPVAVGNLTTRPTEQPTVSGWLSALAALAVVAVVTVRQLLVGRSIVAPSSIAEGALGSNAYALNAGYSTSPMSIGDTITTWFVAVYNVLTGAPSRYDALAESTREFFVVVAAVGALATFLLCRRLTLGVFASVAAVLLAGIPTVAAAVRVIAWPGALASSLALISVLLFVIAMQGRGLRWFAAVAALVVAVVAVAVAPIAILIPLGLLLATVVTGINDSSWEMRDRVLALTASGIAFVGAARIGVLDSTGSEPVNLQNSTVVAVAVLGLPAIVACLCVRWLRPFAIAGAPIIVAALWPGDHQADAIVLALAPAAILLMAAVDHAVTSSSRWRLPLRAVGVVAVLAVVISGAIAAVPRVAVAEPPAAHYLPAATWIKDNLPPNSLILVSPLAWAELIRAGVPSAQLVRRGESTATRPPFVLGPQSENSELPVLATFGTGGLTLEMRQNVENPAAMKTLLRADVGNRKTYGTELAKNKALVLTAQARQALTAGEVDARLMVVISQALSQMKLTVVEFPITSGSLPNGIRREALITNVTNLMPGSPVGAASARLTQFLQVQQPPYAPSLVRASSGTVTVRYPAPSPVGLLK